MAKASTVPNAFAERMRRQLQGARFRWINEQMYTVDSRHAVELFGRDPDLFRVVRRRHRRPPAGSGMDACGRGAPA